MQEMDIAEVARGRRITAVAAKDLELTPRKAERPKRPQPLKKMLGWTKKLTGLSSSNLPKT